MRKTSGRLEARGVDITRFKTADRLVSYTGSCPRAYRSGNATRHGRMKGVKPERRVNWMAFSMRPGRYC